jgi:hypothetical protein
LTKYALFFAVIMACPAHGQDWVFLVNGDSMTAYVKNITDRKLVYWLNKPSKEKKQRMRLTEVRRVEAATGEVTHFWDGEIVPVAPSELFVMGLTDAEKHYPGSRLAEAITFGSSVLNPLLGIATAIVFSASTPKNHRLKYPDEARMELADYKTGYVFGAERKKGRRLGIMQVTGAGVWLVASILLDSDE